MFPLGIYMGGFEEGTINNTLRNYTLYLYEKYVHLCQ